MPIAGANAKLTRPESGVADGRGVLRGEHFQMAYATNDLPRARALFGERYGLRDWTVLEGELDQGGRIRVELAWAGALMYELLWAEGDGSEVYRAVLSDEPHFQLRHHHLGYMIYDQGEWDALIDHAKAQGWNIALQRDNPGFLSSCMIHAPELGHFLEYILPEPAGVEFFNNVARN